MTSDTSPNEPEPRPSGRVRMGAAERRTQIVTYATRIISERGYAGLTVHDLARACGLTNSGLLHYFESKDHILLAVIARREARLEEVALASIQSDKLTGDEVGVDATSLLATLVSVMAVEQKQPELVRLDAVLRAEALNDQHPAHEYYKRRSENTVRQIARVIDGSVTKPAMVAVQIASALIGVEQQWIMSAQAFDLVEAFEGMVDGILSRAAASGTK